MRSVFTAQQMKEADRICEQKRNISSLTLMSKAALALTRVCASAIPAPARILFLCGKGNNAGDGFAASRLLAEKGYQVTVALLCGRKFSPDAAVMFRTVNEDLIRTETVEIAVEADRAQLVVDCVFGTGFQGELPEQIKEVFDLVRNKPIVACDIPSGISCDDGKVCDGVLRATQTVTFAAYKPCFFLYPAKDFCGKVTCADIGIPKDVLGSLGPAIDLPDDELIRRTIRNRPENSHKGIFGTLLTVCGSPGMTGAAVLSAQGALRCGVGLVHMALPPMLIPILQTRLTEPVFSRRKGTPRCNAVLAGCGLGDDEKALKFALAQKKPTVLDADALNIISKNPDLLTDFLDENPGTDLILTPHPAELARLMNTTASRIETDRMGAVRKFLETYPVTLVLKGHHTIIASGDKTYLNLTGNSGLAKGGSGDVLAGMIASFLAQGYPAEDAALCGVYLHGAAADLLKQTTSEHGMLPSDLPEAVGRLLKKYETIA